MFGVPGVNYENTDTEKPKCKAANVLDILIVVYSLPSSLKRATITQSGKSVILESAVKAAVCSLFGA